MCGITGIISNDRQDKIKACSEMIAHRGPDDNGILQLDNFRTLKGFGWPGFKSKKLFKQDKGHYNEIQSFLESIKSDSNPPIPFDELIEVSQITIKIADSL